MSKIESEKLYKKFKVGERAYQEKIHCPMILDVMNTDGTMTAFCKKAFISDALFSKWTREHEIFNRCYQYGKILSKSNWDAEGERGKTDEYFNYNYWRSIGSQRYGHGKNKIRMGIEADANPYEQYKQLVEVANTGEFNSSEIKQLMESVNVGKGAYESFELQKQIDKVKEDLNRMGINNVNNSNAIEKVTKTD